MHWQLSLDENFVVVNTSQIKDVEFKKFVFPGGEIGFKLNSRLDCEDEVIISHRITDSQKLMELVFSVDALVNVGIKRSNISIILPYFPYARQDRVCNYGESLSVRVVAGIINSLGVDNIMILDSHSDVTPALLNNCYNLGALGYAAQAFKESGASVVISPDAGATKKVFGYAQQIQHCDLVTCEKHRDLNTGKLSGFSVHCDDLQGKNCIIFDDICDGGGTFIGLAQELLKKNAGHLYLYVTHGIFSNGFDELGKYFTKIYCTNSFRDVDCNSLVKQYQIQIHI